VHGPVCTTIRRLDGSFIKNRDVRYEVQNPGSPLHILQSVISVGLFCSMGVRVTICTAPKTSILERVQTDTSRVASGESFIEMGSCTYIHGPASDIF
jgi:hypothetical protein